MVKKFILLFFFLITSQKLISQEINNWFYQEANGFLELMKGSDKQNNDNYELYLNYVKKNFAVKSIAYSLINEEIINNSSKFLNINNGIIFTSSGVGSINSYLYIFN